MTLISRFQNVRLPKPPRGAGNWIRKQADHPALRYAERHRTLMGGLIASGGLALGLLSGYAASDSGMDQDTYCRQTAVAPAMDDSLTGAMTKADSRAIQNREAQCDDAAELETAARWAQFVAMLLSAGGVGVMLQERSRNTTRTEPAEALPFKNSAEKLRETQQTLLQKLGDSGDWQNPAKARRSAS